ncbi:putative MarR family transcriptional regulator [Gordonia sihwensis NBRC 108236]|uniref:Putative MarR family transcriptional regulator n=2 Tax=Gordoniaceae TaxID=85026 RepID=L7LQ10_9ACTN|nr:putative MarR family transcriptional regulator [Gordonia sihwensis NBRC 108236]
MYVNFLTLNTVCHYIDMSQEGVGIDLEASVGYALKEASSALRAAMEEVLRPLGMNVTYYSCLELLRQRPGLSNSELARGAFVTRQAMNVLLQTLERDGYVTRASAAPTGRALPTRLTTRGRRRLQTASSAIRAVENRMLIGLDEAERAAVFRALQKMTQSLHDAAGGTDP